MPLMRRKGPWVTFERRDEPMMKPIVLREGDELVIPRVAQGGSVVLGSITLVVKSIRDEPYDA